MGKAKKEDKKEDKKENKKENNKIKKHFYGHFHKSNLEIINEIDHHLLDINEFYHLYPY